MKVIRSFGYAFQGIVLGLEDRNLKIQMFCAVVAVLLGTYLQLSMLEWGAVIFSIGLVLSVELINTAIEQLINALTTKYPELYPVTGAPKDLAAGASLIASIAALAVGVMIFVPKAILLFIL